MEQRARRLVAVGIMSGVALIGAWACDAGSMAGDAGSMLGDAMVDAGSALRDASETVADAMGSDAAAQDPPRDVSCDIERTRTVETGTTRTTTTWWLAELVDPSIEPDTTESVETLLCDREYFGPPPWADAECPMGSTCTGVGSLAPPALRCVIGSGAEIESGRIRVHCGSRYVFENSATGMGGESGSRAASVRITVR